MLVVLSINSLFNDGQFGPHVRREHSQHFIIGDAGSARPAASIQVEGVRCRVYSVNGLIGCTGRRKVDARLPGKEISNSHGAKPVHLTITMIKWIWTSRLSIKNSLSLPARGAAPRGRSCLQSAGFDRVNSLSVLLCKLQGVGFLV